MTSRRDKDAYASDRPRTRRAQTEETNITEYYGAAGAEIGSPAFAVSRPSHLRAGSNHAISVSSVCRQKTPWRSAATGFGVCAFAYARFLNLRVLSSSVKPPALVDAVGFAEGGVEREFFGGAGRHLDAEGRGRCVEARRDRLAGRDLFGCREVDRDFAGERAFVQRQDRGRRVERAVGVVERPVAILDGFSAQGRRGVARKRDPGETADVARDRPGEAGAVEAPRHRGHGGIEVPNSPAV